MAFTKNTSIHTPYPPHRTCLIFSFITRDIFPMLFHLLHLPYEKVTEQVRHFSIHTIDNLLRQKIIIVSRSKIIFCTRLAAKGFTVTDFLQVVQTAGNALIAIAVEGIEA